MRTADFCYDLPEDAIAQSAIEPRDSSRLLDTRDLSDHRFSALPALLREGDLVVLNRTRVRRARLHGTKDTGGAVEALLLGPDGGGRWEALVRPARRIRVGTEISIGATTATVVAGPDDGRVLLEATVGSFEAAMGEVGEVPLPPYFHGTLADPERYQTVFADREGSAAAPTAGLHVTEGVVAGLAAAGVSTAYVDLDVGLDTFRPISADRLEDHAMHSERWQVDADAAAAVAAARARGGRIVAVGTTVVRTLESAAGDDGTVTAGEGRTDLFITPGHRFRCVDLLVTNFHVPGSTLVVLVAAFMGERWRRAYESALERGYRFLSFGDAMLAERAA
jgi:S-adenosylmethionine:tRNA ribosyltransferase-isomerase